MSVKGMTETCKTPATTHQNVAPASHAAIEDSRAHGCQRHLHDRFPVIARRKFSRSYFDAAFHSGWMFNEADVYGGSREQAAGEHSDEFSNLTHQPPFLHEGLNEPPSVGVHRALTKTQVGKHKSVARDDFSWLDWQVALKHRACIHERVEFSVLAAGVDAWWEFREQLLIKFSAHEFRR